MNDDLSDTVNELSAKAFFPQRCPFPNPKALNLFSPFYINCGTYHVGCLRYNKLERRRDRVLVCFHGNAELCSDYARSVKWMNPYSSPWKHSIILVEYPGYGVSDGTPGLAAILEETSHISTALEKDFRHAVAYGRSIGSIACLKYAHDSHSVRGVILDSPVLSVLDFFKKVLTDSVPPEDLITLGSYIQKNVDNESRLLKFPGNILLMEAKDDWFFEENVKTMCKLFEATQGHVFDILCPPSGSVELCEEEILSNLSPSCQENLKHIINNIRPSCLHQLQGEHSRAYLLATKLQGQVLAFCIFEKGAHNYVRKVNADLIPEVLTWYLKESNLQ